MVDPAPPPALTAVRLYTEHYLVRGRMSTMKGSLLDALNGAAEEIILEDAFFDEFASREIVGQAPFAQVNLSMVILAAFDAEFEEGVEAPEPAAGNQVMIGVPPYRVTGHVELGNQPDLRKLLDRMSGRFIEVTDATFWSESLNEPRKRTRVLAVNHARAHVVAPFEERDVWAGVDDVTLRRPDADTVQSLEFAEPSNAGVWVMDSDVGSLAPGEA
jgi:hypothetical protein